MENQNSNIMAFLYVMEKDAGFLQAASSPILRFAKGAFTKARPTGEWKSGTFSAGRNVRKFVKKQITDPVASAFKRNPEKMKAYNQEIKTWQKNKPKKPLSPAAQRGKDVVGSVLETGAIVGGIGALGAGYGMATAKPDISNVIGNQG